MKRKRLGALVLAGALAAAGLAVVVSGGCGKGGKEAPAGAAGTPGGPAAKPPAQAPAAAAAADFVNERCPIIGGEIEPEKVTPDLARTFKGQRVAFCCAGCPPEWDRLSEAEREAKLAAVRKGAVGG